jgi:hypothetical protein
MSSTIVYTFRCVREIKGWSCLYLLPTDGLSESERVEGTWERMLDLVLTG